MASTSYLSVTQTPATITPNTYITSTSTTGVISSDWTNSGNGTYTYGGLTPNQFLVHLDFSWTGPGGGVTRGIQVVKSNLYNTSSTIPILKVYQSATGGGGALSSTACSSPFIMVNGDYLKLMWIGTASGSISSSFIEVIIANIPYNITSNSYLVSSFSGSIVTAGIALAGTSTNVTKTSDWSDNTTMKWTYSGANPVIVSLFLDFTLTNYSHGSPPTLCIIKNGIYNGTTSATDIPFKQWALTVSTKCQLSQTTSPFIMSNGDYIQIMWVAASDLATYNGKVYFSNTKV